MRNVRNVRDLRRWVRLARRFGNRAALEAAYAGLGLPAFPAPPAPQPTDDVLAELILGELRTRRGGDPTPYNPAAVWMPPVDPWPLEMLRDLVPVAVGLVTTIAWLALVVVIANFRGEGPVSDATMLDWSSRFAVVLLICSIAGFVLMLVPPVFTVTDPDLRRMVMIATALAGALCIIIIYLIEGTKAEVNALEVVLWVAFAALAIGSLTAFARTIRD